MQSTLVTTPVYQQLNQLLRDLIRSGEYAPGAQFLTERQICERFGVSRATANKALSNLVAEGQLAFKKGVGTFVRNGALRDGPRAPVSFAEKALAAGKSPTTRVLALRDLRTADAPDEVARSLRAAPDEPLWLVERLRLADRLPVIFERRYILARDCPGLAQEDLEGSLHALWSRHYRLEIGGADEVIHAVLLRGGQAKILGVRSGSPGFQVRATGLLATGAPLWWEESWCRGDQYEFRNYQGSGQRATVSTGALRTE